MDLGIKRETFGSEDRRWLASGHGFDDTQGCTLDGDLFPVGTFPDGRIPSGTVIGYVAGDRKQAGPYAGRTNEVQTINLGAATAGTITITFDGETTAAIAFNATAAAVQAALEALSNIAPGDITVTGGPLPGTITLTFGGRYAATNVPQVTVTPTGLTGGVVTVATTTQGGSAVNDGRQIARGHLLTSLDGVTAGRSVTGAVLTKGTVNRNVLPANSGHDAAAEADLPTIRYQDL